MFRGKQRPLDIFVFLLWAFWASSPRQSCAVKEGQRWELPSLSLTAAAVYIGTSGSGSGCSFGNCCEICTVPGGRGGGSSPFCLLPHSQWGSNLLCCLLFYQLGLCNHFIRGWVNNNYPTHSNFIANPVLPSLLITAPCFPWKINSRDWQLNSRFHLLQKSLHVASGKVCGG